MQTVTTKPANIGCTLPFQGYTAWGAQKGKAQTGGSPPTSVGGNKKIGGLQGLVPDGLLLLLCLPLPLQVQGNHSSHWPQIPKQVGAFVSYLQNRFPLSIKSKLRRFTKPTMVQKFLWKSIFDTGKSWSRNRTFSDLLNILVELEMNLSC